MTLASVLVKESRGFPTKDTGKNAFLRDIPKGCKVYPFHYPEGLPNQQFGDRLSRFGELTGKNLYVNIRGRDDPDFNKITLTFGIKGFPAIIITSLDELASIQTEDKGSIVYAKKNVKLDTEHIAYSVDLVVELVEEIYLLFFREEIKL